jgi:hypothetical protein
MAPNLLEYPLALKGASLLPQKPCPSVEKLSFAFGQSFSILASDESLSNLFPNLVSLKLCCSLMLFQPNFLQALPSTLIDLEILSSTARDADSITPYSALSTLPPGLQTLILRIGNLEGSLADVDQVKLPVGLITLKFEMSCHIALVKRLPSTVTHLEMRIGQAGKVKSSELPPQLRHLALRTQSLIARDANILEFDVPFPASLTFLMLFGTPMDRSQALEFLPKSLTHFMQTRTIDDLGAILPNLTDLDVISSESAVLPKNLKILHTRSILPAQLLPGTLEQLTIPSYVSPDVLGSWYLPNLTSLKLVIPTGTHLPPTVLSEAILAPFMPTLVEFEVPLEGLESLGAIYAFKRLQKLTLSIPSSMPSQHLTRLETPWLPETVTDFKFIRHALNSTSSFLPLLKHFKTSHLVRLFVSTTGLEDIIRERRVQSQSMRISPPSSEVALTLPDTKHPVIQFLPPSLLELNIAIPPWICDNPLEALPKDLRTLGILPVFDPMGTELSTTVFTDLPLSLTSLHVISDSSPLWHHQLPPHIVRIFPSHESRAVTYYSGPQWEGLDPRRIATGQ